MIGESPLLMLVCICNILLCCITRKSQIKTALSGHWFLTKALVAMSSEMCSLDNMIKYAALTILVYKIDTSAGTDSHCHTSSEEGYM